MRKIIRHYPTIASSIALVVALTTAGAYAGGLITSKDIQNRTIRQADLRKNAVTPKKVQFPMATRVGPRSRAAAESRVAVGDTPQEVAVLGTYTKGDANSVLQVTWIGTVGNFDLGVCVMQLRVDDQPPVGGGAEIYVASGAPLNISVQGLFAGLSKGDHEISVWGRRVQSPAPTANCIVNPPETTIPSTVNVAELVN